MTGKPQNIPKSQSVNHFAQIPIALPSVPEGFFSYLFLIVCNEAGEKEFRRQGTVTLPLSPPGALYINPIFSKGKRRCWVPYKTKKLLSFDINLTKFIANCFFKYRQIPRVRVMYLSASILTGFEGVFFGPVEEAKKNEML